MLVEKNVQCVRVHLLGGCGVLGDTRSEGTVSSGALTRMVRRVRGHSLKVHVVLKVYKIS